MATLNITEQDLESLQTKVANDQISISDAWAIPQSPFLVTRFPCAAAYV